ncbi:universal stress protein [Sphingomonas sp. 37zxx]|uniref:universal stress protein n=1 Tax=Sphingomonas sp. 37zxx TaxID=1550073 RepID=UPI00068F409E|nr:universal stress protein [Sphingomonas sp. 37zxx]
MLADLLALVDDPERALPFLRAVHDFGAANGRPHLTVMLLNDVFAAIDALDADADPSDAMLAFDAAEKRSIELLRSALDRSELSLELRAITDAPGFLSGAARVEGRYADMMLVGPRSAYRSERLRRRCIESALMSGSGPVLLFPEGVGLSVLAQAVVGWDASPEARAAVRELTRLLPSGARIDIALVDPADARPNRPAPGSDIARHLARHGYAVTLHVLSSAGRDVSAVLERFALEQKADLLAIGGFAHSRVRDILLGGVTRHLIEAARLPVLLAR